MLLLLMLMLMLLLLPLPLPLLPHRAEVQRVASPLLRREGALRALHAIFTGRHDCASGLTCAVDTVHAYMCVCVCARAYVYIYIYI